MAKKTESAPPGDLARAKALYVDGDYKAARALAKAVLGRADSDEAARAEAQRIVESTRIARPSIIAGLVMLAVVAALFAWVLSRSHVH